MKKRLPVLLSIGLLAMILSGCGDTSPGDSSQEETGSAIEQETQESSDAESGMSDTGETDNSVSYYGTWEVMDYQSAEFSALSSDDMESFRGITITYQPDSIFLDEVKATDDNFTYKSDDTAYDYDSLTEVYRVNLGEWWNNINEVTYVTAESNEGFFGSQFFVVDADTIWIYYEGAFFLAKSLNVE